MDVFQFYTAATAIWTGTQGLVLLVSPTLISTLLKSAPSSPTPLESYLCAALGISVMAIGMLSVLLTGFIPLTSSMRSASATNRQDEESDRKGSSYNVPSLVITLVYHTTMSFLMYSHGLHSGRAFYLGSAISAMLGLVGGWCLLFGTSGGMITRDSILDDQKHRRGTNILGASGRSTSNVKSTTRTSGFPIPNAAHEEAKSK